MTGASEHRGQAVVHLIQQNTVSFSAAQLWPMDGAYSRFGPDIDSFAREVARRLQEDGYVGFRANDGSISIIPFTAVKRIDFAAAD
ncbi:MAG TPA: hypothetical protein VFE19_13465 [Jatrophihabitantaceae bacterium]|jgi:outer membrane receptor protein involved in Fe transport|nr:hypothetical protein [Jatrophihabitantaceae bacterium]